MKYKGQKLTVDNRFTLQACIAKKMKIKDIAKRLNVDISTVYRELERNIIIKESPIQCIELNFLLYATIVLKRMYVPKRDIIMILLTQII